jgi:hypothetical protein
VNKSSWKTLNIWLKYFTYIQILWSLSVKGPCKICNFSFISICKIDSDVLIHNNIVTLWTIRRRIYSRWIFVMTQILQKKKTFEFNSQLSKHAKTAPQCIELCFWQCYILMLVYMYQKSTFICAVCCVAIHRLLVRCSSVMKPCGLVGEGNVSEEHTASIFRVMRYFGASTGIKWEIKYFNQAKCLPKYIFSLPSTFRSK